MAERIIWSRQAVADRIQILDYWFKRLGTKDYSQKLNQTFQDTIKLLSEYPFVGRKLQNREERVFVKDRYQIFYLADEDFIRILHIWDSRRDPDDLTL